MGCGPSGIVIVLAASMPSGAMLVGVAPRLDENPKLSPALNELDVQWVAAAFEDYQPDGKFDLIFAINSIDHCRDLEAFVRRLREAVVPGAPCGFPSTATPRGGVRSSFGVFT